MMPRRFMRNAQTSPVVSAVIVTHESGDLASDAMRSFEAAFAGLALETIVVDNASGSPRFPEGSIAIRNEENRGFGAACNDGAAAARAPVLLFLNPDARLGPGRWREVLAHFDANPRVAAIGVLRSDPNGDPARDDVPPPLTLGQLLREVFVAGAARRRPARPEAGPAFEPVCWLPASCLFVRAQAFAEVGGFDETFFLYFEDVDLCARIRRAGHEVVLARLAEAIHREAGHEKYHDQARLAHYFAGLVTYFAKWRPRVLPWVRALVLARVAARAFYWSFARLRGRIEGGAFRERMNGYGTVVGRLLLGRATGAHAERGRIAAEAMAAPPGPRPRVSVCIPSRDRRELLLRALDALGRQTLDPAAFEVIVADDGSTDGTPHALRRAVSERRWPPLVRVLALPQAGPAAARNAAAAAARAPVLAFADSDVVPDPGWLAAGLARLARDERAGGVEGRTVVREAARITPFTHQTRGDGGRYPTCNLFVRKEAFDAVGGFDPRFGGRHFFREDSDLAFRLLDAGLLLPFEERAVVDHPPLRGGLTTPLRLARRYRYDPLLKRKHPRRFARELDRATILGRTLARPRQRLYATNLALALAGAVVSGLGAPAWLAASAWIGYAASSALVLAAHRPLRAASVLELAAIVPVSAAVPVVYGLSILEGWWALRSRRGYPC